MFTVRNFAYLEFYDHILCGISQLSTTLTATESSLFVAFCCCAALYADFVLFFPLPASERLASVCHWIAVCQLRQNRVNSDYNRTSIFFPICNVELVFLLLSLSVSFVHNFCVCVWQFLCSHVRLFWHKQSRINFNDINCGFLFPFELNFILLLNFFGYFCIVNARLKTCTAITSLDQTE